MLWAFWSLGNAIVFGMVSQVNRYWQIPGHVLVRWRSFVPAMAMLPFVFFVHPPTSPYFYVAALISSVLVPMHDVRMFNITGLYGGAVVLRLRSLMLPLVFFGWLLIDHNYVREFMARPPIGLGILACMGFSTFFLFQLQHCTITRAAMGQTLPIIVMGAMFDIANKTAMDHASFPSNVVYYIFIVSGMPIIYGLIRHFREPKKFVADMAAIGDKGLMMGCLWVVMMSCKNVAMMITPNPAYVTAVVSTAPFWASLVVALRGEKEEADWVSGSALVASIIVLTVLSGFVPHGVPAG